MKLSLLVFPALVSIPLAHAAPTDRICKDLYTPTCSEGINKDPTGNATKRNFDLFDQQKIEGHFSTLIDQMVDKTLADPSNRGFYETALEGYGLSELPECKNPENQDCKIKISAAVQNQLRQEVFYPELDPTPKGLKPKDLLRPLISLHIKSWWQ